MSGQALCRSRHFDPGRLRPARPDLEEPGVQVRSGDLIALGCLVPCSDAERHRQGPRPTVHERAAGRHHRVQDKASPTRDGRRRREHPGLLPTGGRWRRRPGRAHRGDRGRHRNGQVLRSAGSRAGDGTHARQTPRRVEFDGGAPAPVRGEGRSDSAVPAAAGLQLRGGKGPAPLRLHSPPDGRRHGSGPAGPAA